jgi:3'-phosphoadenosine 5'-phosphosulfate sulfotransferase (PAPS reductase)/FAD synthetase
MASDTLVVLLRDIATRHAPAVLATGFGVEGMLLIDLIARHALPIRIFTLDTGRLPEETHALIDRTRQRYGLPIDVYAPRRTRNSRDDDLNRRRTASTTLNSAPPVSDPLSA